MELGLSLGDSPKPFVFLNNKTPLTNHNHNNNNITLGFCVGLSNHSASGSGSGSNHSDHEGREEIHEDEEEDEEEERTVVVVSDPPIQLDLLPLAPVPRTSLRFPWLSHHLMPEMGFSNGGGERDLDVNRLPMMEETTTEDRAAISSPNSTVSSFQMDFGVRKSSSKRDFEVEIEETRASSRVSDDDENGSAARKKLRLSKQQSAFLEDSFKEHSTLNPKQKLALAKQLNLRPRQVEVWFQNRRARTKLKQTEVDCEYLRRCCETLTEENRRLQKELQELRALKTSQPFYMQLPATTLTMCPSCERVATTAPASASATVKPITSTATASATNSTLCLAKPRTFPFTHSQSHLHQTAS